MVGTFLINPGNAAYKKRQKKWETEAGAGGGWMRTHFHPIDR